MCGAHENVISKRDNISFFDTVKASISKNTGAGILIPEGVDTAVGELVDKSMTSFGVQDLLVAAGITKTPEISILSDEFLQDVSNTKKKNLVVELLTKLVSDEIKIRRKKNVVDAYSLSQKLQKTLEAYEKRPVDTVEVITGLIDLSKQIRDAKKRGEKLNLSEDELAFYDALETNDSEVKNIRR